MGTFVIWNSCFFSVFVLIVCMRIHLLCVCPFGMFVRTESVGAHLQIYSRNALLLLELFILYIYRFNVCLHCKIINHALSLSLIRHVCVDELILLVLSFELSLFFCCLLGCLCL